MKVKIPRHRLDLQEELGLIVSTGPDSKYLYVPMKLNQMDDDVFELKMIQLVDMPKEEVDALAKHEKLMFRDGDIKIKDEHVPKDISNTNSLLGPSAGKSFTNEMRALKEEARMSEYKDEQMGDLFRAITNEIVTSRDSQVTADLLKLKFEVIKHIHKT